MLDLAKYQEKIESALIHGGDTHTFQDVAKMVIEGKAQAWVNGESIAITEIVDFPRKRNLHCFLAAGKSKEIIEMMPSAMEWGQSLGCSSFTIAGRKGWKRLLERHGWRQTLQVMEMPMRGVEV